MLKEPEIFMASLEAVQTGPLDESQRGVLTELLEAAEGWCTGWTAYLLATAWHECRMRPEGLCANPATLALDMAGGRITGKSLRQYILAGRGDEVAFRHCRRVVLLPRAAEGEEPSAHDFDTQADVVALIALQMRELLRVGGWRYWRGQPASHTPSHSPWLTTAARL